MRALLSTIGSRGDVQPLVALAVQLRELGHEAHLCVPPDLREWIGSYGFSSTPVGPELHRSAKPGAPAVPVHEGRKWLMPDSVAAQFTAVREAAEGCDVLLAGGALQFATRSLAEKTGTGYAYVSYCPMTLPSVHHSPPPFGPRPSKFVDNRTRWVWDAQRWDGHVGDEINAHRVAAGLKPITDVRDHIFGDRPFLATDPVLGPWPGSDELDVVHTGAWLLPDDRPLPPELESFLDAGDPPIYLGFGSVRAPRGLAEALIGAARSLGRRVIVLRGWTGLALVDDAPDCFSVGEVNHQALFKRVAVVVHHGGAGTTTAAARAGTPQVLLPQGYDQHYWARRVEALGIGHAHPPGTPTADSVTAALSHALRPEVVTRALSLSAEIRTDGARAAAERLVTTALGSTY
ncbi:glycosyltransferase [Allokutzneria sp. A3M-2-11 16]|uniref:glycosyltransferase n=1 Tax=Allokutzneria sp. A3M-2-11 16 TaxID=2962043 RepID=UPI0020B66F06|nr:glycosyltransferase [Allokutzneria sp. A3M-2-11 16]MCP3804460.1 glycosyltransferase [Allokutzneria sp. A3M-2-11 16]